MKLKNEEVEAITAACTEMTATERESAEKDIQAALPTLRRAEDAVSSLDNKDIVEIKTTKIKHHMKSSNIYLIWCVFTSRPN